jgi:hypothetical protein
MKATLPKKKHKTGRRGSLNAVVYSLLALAVVLGGVAAWQRYSQRAQSEPGDAAERRIDPLLARLGVPDSWVSVGGRPGAAAPQCRFVCTQCQASCWTTTRGGLLGCPFCGLAMTRQGLGSWDVRISPVGGTGTGGAALPIVIQSNAVCPHANRGACGNCHTVVRADTTGLTPAGAVANRPRTLWQGAAAPAIAADAARPTLIKELGVEVCPANGAGVKVTGVMGNSYAARAGLRARDVIIQCNGARVRNVQRFQQLVSQAPPEANAQITIMRNGRTRDVLVMVGEGEMEGFTAIGRR